MIDHRQEAWRCPENHVVTNGCSDADEHHEKAPHGLLFHDKEKCLDAMLEWVRFVASIDPLAVDTTWPHPIAIMSGAERSFEGFREGRVTFKWKTEIVDIVKDGDAIVVIYKSWFMPHQRRSVRTFTKSGTPVGWADEQVPIGGWHPWNEASWDKPSTEGEPKVRRSYRVEAERVLIRWADAEAAP